MIHSYEQFLAAHNPALRKSRGVWYTPQVAVNFVVRAVDDILQTDFNLAAGLADVNVPILDPATGTGTFLVEIVKHIYDQFRNQNNYWQEYVQEYLIPRLAGFEILTEPYEMVHSNLTSLLQQTGCEMADDQRFRIYRTNALQESWTSIFRNTPVMVVLGNPPYNVSTQNKNDWIDGLIADYKKGLNEKNIQPLSDDYIKFIRYGQQFIEKNNGGILAYISNNSFIDGLIHRQMRKNLLEAFDKIYILDLHGNAKKKETALDGSKDENVFNIQQGVSINIFIKTGRKKANTLATVFHADLYGKRAKKYDFLRLSTLQAVSWQKLRFNDENYFFVPKDFRQKAKYEQGFKVDALFLINSSGVKTHDDAHLVSFLPFPENNRLYAYRPFDIRSINYDLKKVQRHRSKLMKHFANGDNVGLLTCRQQSGVSFRHVLVSHVMMDMGALSNLPSETTYVFPLYRNSGQSTIRTPNLDAKIVATIARSIGLEFETEKSGNANKFAPIDIFDYIYAVLHNPAYREKYKEFLKIDFPRVPYPEEAKKFWELVQLGAKLRRLHLLEGIELLPDLVNYPIVGTNIVETLRYTDCKVYINDTQYFGNIPSDAWDFYIGGYQPAQKWLKDRKGRTLNLDEIQHYQKIIRVLIETGKVMNEVNEK